MRGTLAKKLRSLAEKAMPGSAIRHNDHVTRHVPANVHCRTRSTSVIMRCDPNSARAFYSKSKQIVKDPIQAAAAGLKGVAMHRELGRTFNQEVERDVNDGTKINADIQQSMDARYPGVAVTDDAEPQSPTESVLTNSDVNDLLPRGSNPTTIAVDESPVSDTAQADQATQ